MNSLIKLETMNVRVQGIGTKHYRVEPHIFTGLKPKHWFKQMQTTEKTLAQVVEVSLNKYLDDWVDESGVSLGITLLNIEGLTAEEANERIKPKYPIQTGGWWCGGVNWRNGQPVGTRFGQFKPEEKHISDPDKPDKKAKYLCASGVAVDALFLRMPGKNGEVDKYYWKEVYDNKSQILVWTEGAKKAGAGLTLGIPTIGLFGVWNFISNGELNHETKTWFKRGGSQYLAYDSDYRDKPECREAIKRLCEEAKKLGTTIRIVTWDSNYKGMDDFIKGEGKEAFLERINQAETIEQWEKQFNKETSKPPSPNDISKEIAEEYAHELAFNNETGVWMRYEAEDQGVWTPETDIYIESIVSQILEGKGIKLKTHSYLINVIKYLKIHPLIIKRKWPELSPKEILPHTNGVVKIATGDLIDHSPQNYLTWTLPRKYDKDAKDWSKINDWMNEATQGNSALKDLLICFANAVLKGRSDLQKFMHLIGLGGIGDRVVLLYDGRIGEVIEVDNFRRPSLHIRLDNSVTTWENPAYLELAPPKKPEPEPQKDITLKPALVENLTLEQKKEWLHNNQGTNKLVWVKLDNYEGEATLKGKTDSWDKWKVYISGHWGNDVVSIDCIKVLYTQLGKLKLPPEPPEGDQIELNLDNPPQTETSTEAESPSESVKMENPKDLNRLAQKQVSEGDQG